MIVRLNVAQAPVPACDPNTAIDPEAPASDLQSDAVKVGNVDCIPLTQTMNAPKFGRFNIFCAVLVIAMG